VFGAEDLATDVDRYVERVVLDHTDWKKNLAEAALARIRARVDPQKYQLFDFYVNKEWPAAKVAERFGVSVNQVYLARHRLTALLKEEIQRLEEETI
jgi:RNA polymerase sigma-70 factor (ECF subfamily)